MRQRLAVGPARHLVEEREAHADAQARRRGAHRVDRAEREPRARLERRAAVATAARPRGEELVQQVAVTVLDVDERVASALRDRGGAREVPDQRIDLGIREDGRVVTHVRARIEQRVPERDARPARAGIGHRPAPAVRELEADHRLGMPRPLRFLAERRAQRREPAEIRLARDELVRVRAALGLHRDGLAAPDPAGARRTEASPAAQGEIGRPAVARPVPALHRLDHEAVRRDEPGAEIERRGERTLREDRVVAGKRGADLGEARAQRSGRAQRSDARPALRHDAPLPHSASMTPRSHAASSATFASTGFGSQERNSIVSGPA